MRSAVTATALAASFAQWQLSGAESYLGSDAMAADYHDPVDPGNDIAARVPRVAPAGRCSGRRTELERLSPRNGLPCIPKGCEAWAEQRRTGYPRLFPVRLNHSKGYIDTETMIRRAAVPGRAGDVRSRAVCGARRGTRWRRPRGDAPVVGRGAQFLIRKPRTVLPGRCVVRRLSEFPACAQQDIARADGIAVGARAYSVEGRIGIFFTAEKVCGGRRSFPFPVYFPAQRCVGQ